MNINFNDITGVSQDRDGKIAIFLKSMADKFPSPSVVLKPSKAKLFLRVYRRFLLDKEKPEDRIIPGIDDQKDGHYSMEAENEAIKNVMKMAEKKTRLKMHPSIVTFLHDIVTFQEKASEYQVDALQMFAEIKKAIPAMQNEWTIEEVDALKNTITGISKVVEGVSEIKKNLLPMLDAWNV